jgi:hypothetical protein
VATSPCDAVRELALVPTALGHRGCYAPALPRPRRAGRRACVSKVSWVVPPWTGENS